MVKKTNWAPEEDAVLREKWGKVSIPKIAETLGRSVSSIKNRSVRLKLGRHIHNSSNYITINQMFRALGISYNDYTYDRWLKHGLPAKTKKSVSRPYRIIGKKDFWRWAEQHKMFIDFSRLEPGALGPEPMWVAYKRSADKKAAAYKRRRKWTEGEDAVFRRMLMSYSYTYRDISVALQRTESALKRRFRDLGIKHRPLAEAKNENPWTPEQVETLKELYNIGYIAEVMAEYIPKSASAIKAKIERLEKEGELEPSRTWSPPESQSKAKLENGIHYKDVLPESKWPTVEKFLACFANYANLAQEMGASMDVSAFMKEYVAVNE